MTLRRQGIPGVRVCENCGAPPAAGLAACLYCKTAYAGVPVGVRCHRCNAQNAAGNTTCPQCRTELTRACVFCQAVSSLDRPACVRCREPFEGAAERLQAREDARKRKEYMNLASQGLGAAVTVATSDAGQGILGALVNALTDD
jgi:hypothetical protein